MDGFGALSEVIAAIPQWLLVLDGLNSKMINQHDETPEQESPRRNLHRSVKRSGSDKSLRPIDGFFALDESQVNGQYGDALHTKSGSTSPAIFSGRQSKRPHSPNAAMPARLHARHSSLNKSSMPRIREAYVATANTTPGLLSQLKALHPRKRRPDPQASIEVPTLVPQMRSFTAVYYNAGVQESFGQLVKSVSTCRNMMRKGKMAAKMAEMRRAAQLEADTAEDIAITNMRFEHRSRCGQNGRSAKIPIMADTYDLEADDSPDGDTDDIDMHDLSYTSTRRIAPICGVGLKPPGCHERQHRPQTGSEEALRSSLFDELDAGLEWCQSMCEHAAHQFLREGACGTEVEKIKRRLVEVRSLAEGEMLKTQSVGLNGGLKQEQLERRLHGLAPRYESNGVRESSVSNIGHSQAKQKPIQTSHRAEQEALLPQRVSSRAEIAKQAGSATTDLGVDLLEADEDGSTCQDVPLKPAYIPRRHGRI